MGRHSQHHTDNNGSQKPTHRPHTHSMPPHHPPPRKPSARSRSLSRIPSLRSGSACSATPLRRDRASPFHSTRSLFGRFTAQDVGTRGARSLAGDEDRRVARQRAPCEGRVRREHRERRTSRLGRNEARSRSCPWWTRRARPARPQGAKRPRPCLRTASAGSREQLDPARRPQAPQRSEERSAPPGRSSRSRASGAVS